MSRCTRTNKRIEMTTHTSFKTQDPVSPVQDQRDVTPFQNQRFWLRFRYGCLALTLWCAGVWIWTACPAGGCKQDSDCTSPQVCRSGQCIQPNEKIPSTESGQEKSADAGSEPQTESIAEPPPFPDVTWGEGRLPPPETLGENQPLPTQGTRKVGETCNPFTTALPQDRCIPNHLCATTSTGTTGICFESCDPKANTCKTGSRCVEIFSPDLRQSQGHACVPTTPVGYPCSQAVACEQGHVCMSYNTETAGICRKACQQKDDCPQQWCYSNQDVTGKEVTGCSPFVEKADEPCPTQTVCGSGLNCHGSSEQKRCLQNCTADMKCPSTHTCKEVKDSAGKIIYALCFRNTKAGEYCDSTTTCEKDYLCVTLASSPYQGRCMRDCGSDSKVCPAGEICDTVSGTTKVCYRSAQEKQPCGGEFRCESGLSCVKTQEQGPNHCLKTCDTKTPCPAGQQCLQLQSGNNIPSVCVHGCDPKATQPCAATDTECVDKVASSPVCLPALAGWSGQLPVGSPCSPHATLPAAQRCQPSLVCTSLVDGWYCLQPCNTATSCPQGQQCLRDHRTQQTYCAVGAEVSQACHIAKAQLCKPGLFCLQATSSSQGLCVTEQVQPLGAYCHVQNRPCQITDLCSGDPLTPFRWICRTICDDKATPSCSASQTCLPTTQGSGACFDNCATNNTCSNLRETCTDIQKKKVCM